MKKATIELDYATLDKLVKEQLEQWLSFYLEETTKASHPDDRKESYKKAGAIYTILEMFEDNL